MLVTVYEFWTIVVKDGSKVLLIDDILVAAVVKDCVVMHVVLEEFWNVVDSVVDIFMPVENNGEGVPVEIVVEVVDMLLSVGEVWTVGVVTCVNLLIEETEVIEEKSVEVFAVVPNMFLLVEEIRIDAEVGGVVVMPGEIDDDGVPVKIFVGVVDMFLPVGKLWTLGLVTFCVNLLVE